MAEKKSKIRGIIKDFFPYVMIILVVLFVKAFIVSPIRVNGTSMDSTLEDGDIMLLDEISYRFSDIERFDIVVLRRNDEYLIKRVIGLPGEQVKYIDGKLYIDDKYVAENFSHKETDDFNADILEQDEYFVMGDNRTSSMDSRIFGAVSKKQIIGKTSLTLLPFSRFGNKE